MRVSDVMSRTVFTCRAEDRLQCAAQLMWDHDIGCIPVTDGYQVIGMITDRDICMSACLHGGSLMERQVGDVMAPDIRACGPDDDVRIAADRMRMSRVHRLPVIKNNRLIGIIALNDLVLAAAASTGNHLRLDEVGATLAGISQHRSGPCAGMQRVA